MIIVNSSMAAAVKFAGTNDVARRADVSPIVVASIARSVTGAISVVIPPMSPR